MKYKQLLLGFLGIIVSILLFPISVILSIISWLAKLFYELRGGLK